MHLISVLIALGVASVTVGQKSAEVAAPIVSASATSCYQCNSANDGQDDCADSDLAKLEKYIKPCGAITSGTFAGRQANSCRKLLQNVAELDNVVARECAYTGEEEVDGRRRTGNKGIIVWTYQCFNDKNSGKPCNSATSAGLSAVLLVFTSVYALLHFTN